jgi:hypothetical protein
MMSLQSDPTKRATVLLRPFGGATPSIKVFDSARKAKPKKSRKKTRKQGKGGKLQRSFVIAEVPALIGRMLRTIRIEVLRLDAEFGLGDPADTGQVYGQLSPLIFASPWQVNLRPDFGATCLRGTAFAQFRVVPIAFAWPLVGFGWRLFGPFR